MIHRDLTCNSHHEPRAEAAWLMGSSLSMSHFLKLCCVAAILVTLSYDTHAQKRSAVECTIGRQSAIIAEDRCDALLDIQAWMIKRVRPPECSPNDSEFYGKCATYAQHRMGGPTRQEYAFLCTQILTDLVIMCGMRQIGIRQ